MSSLEKKTGNDDRDVCILLHLSVLLGIIVPYAGLVVPLIIWFVKKDESQLVKVEGKIFLNAVVSYIIYSIVAFVLMFILIGFLFLLILVILSFIEPIRAAFRVRNNGAPKNYLFAIDFFNVQHSNG